MKTILVPTDFSNNAYSALYYATQMHRGEACNFCVLHVYDKGSSNASTALEKPNGHNPFHVSQEGLQETLHRIKRDNQDPNHTFNSCSEQGDLVKIIRSKVSQLEVDLLVIGNTGCSELEAIFLGSNALRILSGIGECPILMVPKELDYKPLKQIAFVTDYKQPYDAGLLHPLLLLAKNEAAKIAVMHINESGDLTRDQMINKEILFEYLKPIDSVEHWMPLHKSKATAIADFVNELKIDALTMVNYKYGLIEKLSHEPVIKRMAFNADIPFLIIQPSD